MKKSWKIALDYVRTEKPINFRNFTACSCSVVWAGFYFATNYGDTKFKEFLMDTLALVFAPFIIGYVLTYLYHYLRSDLYQDLDKQELNTQLIFGNLITLVEHWKPEAQPHIFPDNSIKSFNKLKQYRKAYCYDSVHSKIDQFLNYFEVQDVPFNYKVTTKFKNKSEALKELPILKLLAKEIGKEIRA